MECPIDLMGKSCHFMGGSCGDCEKAQKCFQLMGGCTDIKILNSSSDISLEEARKSVHEALSVGNNKLPGDEDG